MVERLTAAAFTARFDLPDWRVLQRRIEATLQRLADALAAGSTLGGDREAPAFSVLADPEGNEACICTWQNREEHRS